MSAIQETHLQDSGFLVGSKVAEPRKLKGQGQQFSEFGKLLNIFRLQLPYL